MSSVDQSRNEHHEQDMGVVFPVHGFRNRDLTWITPMALISASRIAPYISNLDPRGILPEPFDVPNHIGNAAVTFVIMERFANGFWGKQPEAMDAEEYAKRRKTLALTVGILTVAANIFAETVGYGKTSTPDKLDFLYGLAGGIMAYKAKKPVYVESDVVDYWLGTKDENDPFRQRLEKALLEKQERQLYQNGKSKNILGQRRNNPIRPNPHSRVKRSKNKSQMQKKSRQQNRKNK